MSKVIQKSKVVYCHGLPGCADELYFLKPAERAPLIVLGPQHTARQDQFFTENPDSPIQVIGFSLGAMAAIKIAEKHDNQVSKLSLISAAAPLELGDFLPSMAGRPVFQTAARSKLLFKVLTVLQHLGVRCASDRIIRTLFKDSPEADIALLSEPDFKTALATGMKASYGANNVAYRREIEEYVRPWAHRLSAITCPVTICHGTADNWAPIAMAHALQNEIRTVVNVVEYCGEGHFSTLRKALPPLLQG